MTDDHETPAPWLRSKTNLALLVFLGIGAYFLVTEHKAHLFQFLPWLLVLCCIGMLFFMHGNPIHGRRGEEERDDGHRSPGRRE